MVGGISCTLCFTRLDQKCVNWFVTSWTWLYLVPKMLIWKIAGPPKFS
jgi:hypothetical protein